MRISDAEVKNVLSGHAVIKTDTAATNFVIGHELEEEDRIREEQLVREVTASVMKMPDREDMIASLKARIESGEYNPSAEDIVDGMIRRAIADRMK